MCIRDRINFGGVEENVVTREEFPLEKAREVLKNETIAVIGYGVQGPGPVSYTHLPAPTRGRRSSACCTWRSGWP